MFSRTISKIFKKRFVTNYHKYCNFKKGNALVYYKTDPFSLGGRLNQYTHSNNWEIFQMVRILNKYGFWVDILDRTAEIQNLNLQDRYDLFIGLGAGNSGRMYPQIANRLTKAIKILYSTSQEPSVFNNALRRRYEYFHKRHPEQRMQYRGMKEEIDMDQVIRHTDFIFCTGNERTISTYRIYNKPIYEINISTSPKIEFDLHLLYRRSQKMFLYFAGNRNILKGLDLLIECFAELPNLQLYICTPALETEFDSFYADILSKAPNIHWIGFVTVAKKTFNALTSRCAYVILPSCTEGIATSIPTCMRRGLIPITTRDSGLNLDSFGYLIENIQIESLKNQLLKISQESKKEFIRRSIESYQNSFNYTQAKFLESFERALLDVLEKFYV